MIIVKTKKELKQALSQWRLDHPQGTVGFVPTMGYLHEGHASLIRMSGSRCDFTVVSIFINPLQFNDPEDFKRYPVDLDRDMEVCRGMGADLVFLPDQKEMLGDDPPLIEMSASAMTSTLCGPGRPGHFEGVLMIVSRFFNLVRPDFAFFGKKDYQQYKIIQRLVKDLEFPVQITGSETIREEDGLAMSSRNARLIPHDRAIASLIYRGLKLAQKSFADGERNSRVLCEIAEDVIHSSIKNRVEYVQIVDADTLELIDGSLRDDQPFVIAAAVFCGNVRLIDNLECNFQSR